MTDSRLAVSLKCAGVVALGIVLAWQIATRSFVAAQAPEHPERALTLNANDPVALTNVAAQKLETAQRVRLERAAQTTPRETVQPLPRILVDEIKAGAEKALLLDPSNPKTLRVLGQLADDAGDTARARSFMTLAVKASRHETLAVLWVLQDAFARQDFPAMTVAADVLLRTRAATAPLIAPVIMRLAENETARPGVIALLNSNPPWRSAFFELAPPHATDVRTLSGLLQSARATASPPLQVDYVTYLKFLLAQQQYELAYGTWLDALNPEQLLKTGLLYNGGFEDLPTGLPFDWTLEGGPGVTVEFAEGPDLMGRRGLFVEFRHGRIEFGGVSQVLQLPPGAYRLTGKVRGEMAGRRGLEWRLVCLPAEAPPLLQTPMFTGVARDWKALDGAFRVPDELCRAQKLSLTLPARSASEQLTSGTVWYDDLQITAEPPVKR